MREVQLKRMEMKKQLYGVASQRHPSSNPPQRMQRSASSRGNTPKPKKARELPELAEKETGLSQESKKSGKVPD